MFGLVALASILLPLATKAVPCVQFDASWNLYAFGGSSDVNLGQNTTWSSPNPQTLTTTGRPPWTGNNTQCFLSQYNNAMYVLGADASDLGTVYVYNFAGGSWSTQSTSGVPSDLGNSRSASVLDHDTNVILTLTQSSGLYQLDMSGVTSSANSSAAPWTAQLNPGFSTSGYTPVAAEASNHINYFGVPSTAAGSADVFVIHFSYFQPTAQTYPTANNGESFPDTGGQAISIPLAANTAQYQMVFVPNDLSNTYVVTHWTDATNYATTSDAPFAQNLINSTQLLPAPSSKDSNAAYAASPYSLVQVDSGGNIYYMNSPINGDFTVNSGATWSKLSYTLAGLSGMSNNTTSGSSPSGSASMSMSASGSASMSSGASMSMSSGASASATSKSATSASGSSGAAGKAVSLGMRWDLMGMTLSLVAVGGALVL